MSFTFFTMSSFASSLVFRYKTLLIIIGLQLYGIAIINAASIPLKTPLAIRIQQCREGCLEKFATQETLCPNRPECATCWEECAKPPHTKLTKTIQETWSLRTVSMLQQDSLVLVDVSWDPQLNTPNQCLVTWEVSGGGLMGNLLTETYSVQLSLWPDTKYRVQVTCKNKNTGSMSRSLPLNIDTSEAITTHIPIKSTNKPVNIKSTIKQQQKQKIPSTTTQSSLMANLPFATSSSSASIPISAPIPTFMDHPLSSFEDDNNDDIDINIDDQQQQQHEILQQSNELSQSRTKIIIKHPINNNNNNNNNIINRKHTNYIFDLNHDTSSINTNLDNNNNNNNLDETDIQVDKLIPLNQSSDLNIINIETLSDIQKPLLFGILAGILLLTFVLAMYICALRSQRVPSDKIALINDDDGCNSLDNHHHNTSKIQSKNFFNKNCSNNTSYYDANDIINNTINNTTSASDLPTSCNTTNHFGSGPSNILNPNFYSRNVHVLTV